MSEPVINRPNRMGQPPQRHLTLTPQNHLEDTGRSAPQAYTPSSPVAGVMGQLAPEAHLLQESPTGAIGPNQVPGRQTYEGGAPDDPAAQAQIAELLKANGDLVRALGESNKKFELRMKQMQFDVQTQLAARDGAPNIQLPADVDPNAPINAQQLLSVMTKNNLAMEAHSIRSSWDVSPNEEALALQRNPALASLSEPRRTMMIREAVGLLREETAAAPTSAEALAPTGDPNRRPAREVVAAPEMTHSVPAGGSDAPGESELQNAWRQYNDADRLPDPKQRLETKKALYERILKIQGMNSGDILKRSFTMG